MDDLVVQLDAVLEEYNEEFDEAVNRAMFAVANEAAEKLKAISPQGRGHTKYANGWTVDSDFDEKTYIVYNKAQPGLTHLLENGHIKRNQYGTYDGRVEGIKHIKPVEEWANLKVENRIEMELNNVK